MISAVVVVYGLSPELAALVESLKPHDIELIAVVNPAPEPAPDLDDDFDIVINNEVNVGFGQAVNQGALAASGTYLLILNSDVEMPSEWVDELLGPFEDPAVGAVAPVLVDPDGTVQELGSFVGSQGETVAFGRGIANALADDFFERPLDYASAACLIVRRDSFHQVGGFHPVYGIGYFEDVELAFALREQGLRTQLVPSVRVLHHREASFGNLAANELMDKNRSIFVERWRETLDGRPALTDFEKRPYRLVHARDWHIAERLLVVATDPSGQVEQINQLHEAEPQIAITLASHSNPKGLSNAVRCVLSDGFSNWSEAYSFWATMTVYSDDADPNVLALVETTQDPQHSSEVIDEDSLVEIVARLTGRG